MAIIKVLGQVVKWGRAKQPLNGSPLYNHSLVESVRVSGSVPRNYQLCRRLV